MTNSTTTKILSFLLLSLFCACRPTRNLVYFSDLVGNDSYQARVSQVAEIKIQPNDLLAIRVSSLNAESNAIFNQGVISSTTASPATTLDQAVPPAEGYLVDQQGNINFPLLGQVKLGDLTREQAVAQLTKAVEGYVKSPIVTVRLLNFKVTVIGEVSRPSTFTVPTERINVLEALGLAGDLTPYGRRENVLLLREKSGVRTTTRLNLNSKTLLNSPYFYLQQNDVLYVEPDKIKEVQASTNQRSFTIVTIVTSVLVALIFNYQNIFK
ncbi:MAG: sugar transporter [Hymenobacter sp.]|nr:MAG: sugar transporter [Hymenobacter sp.]